jgi:DUF1365 family protein
MLLLDVDELPELDRRLALFGHNRPRPVGFRDADHFFEPVLPVREAVDALLRTRGLEPPGGRLQVLTHARVFGHVFNPVSFLWYRRPDGSIAHRLVEVNNTYGDRHVYVLPGQGAEPPELPKRMHVSPFLDPSGAYRFRVPAPESRLHIGIDLVSGHEVQLQSRLTLERRPLGDATLLRALLRWPLVTMQVLGGIHWEALRLWTKGAGFRLRPDYGSDMATKVST